MIGLLQIDRLLDGDVFGFGLETFTSVMPAPVLALLVFGSIGVGYYMVQGSFAIPLIMFILVNLSPSILGTLALVGFLITNPFPIDLETLWVVPTWLVYTVGGSADYFFT